VKILEPQSISQNVVPLAVIPLIGFCAFQIKNHLRTHTWVVQRPFFCNPKMEKKYSANVTSCQFKIWCVSSLLVFITKMLAEEVIMSTNRCGKTDLKKMLMLCLFDSFLECHTHLGRQSFVTFGEGGHRICQFQ